jgi:excisionase family DNA binding protein
MEIMLTLTDEQLQEIEDRLFKRLKTAISNYGKDARPYTVAEAAEATNISASTLYNRIRAGLIEQVAIAGVKRIPAREVERLQGLR